MANVYIEPRPKGLARGPIEDFVVEDHADQVLMVGRLRLVSPDLRR